MERLINPFIIGRVEDDMITEALQKFKHIELCGSMESWKDCFTYELNHIIFWFNVGSDTFTIVRTK
jgi:hypothetical protein